MTTIVRRLMPENAEIFRAIRLEGFRLQDREFRFSPEDELAVPLETVRARLQTDFVVGAFVSGELVGIAGLSRQGGAKLNHRALLWGMYVKANYRGSGTSNAIMQMLVEYAEKSGTEYIILTVARENSIANRFYERWGFNAYGIDKYAIKLADGSYIDELLMVRCMANQQS